ncbi:MAG: hypothetical protein FWE52_00620 [Alphaproteobacteria bacterium]|nr:hypothetical protein [Alphaproteobacteria bacterium]
MFSRYKANYDCVEFQCVDPLGESFTKDEKLQYDTKVLNTCCTMRSLGYEYNALPDETEPDTGESIQQMVDRCVRIHNMSKKDVNGLINNGVALPEWVQTSLEDKDAKEYTPEELSGLSIEQAEDILEQYDIRMNMIENYLESRGHSFVEEADGESEAEVGQPIQKAKADKKPMDEPSANDNKVE